MFRAAAIVMLSMVFAVVLSGTAEASPASGPDDPDQLTYNLQILTSRSRVATIGTSIYYVVEGVVKNNHNTNIREGYVQAKLFTVEGLEIAQAAYPIDMQIVDPGGTSSFDVWVSYPSGRLVTRYELSPYALPTTNPRLKDLHVINVLTQFRNGRFETLGEIINSGSRATDDGDGPGSKNTRLYVVAYDAAGRIVDYANPGFFYILNPGTYAPFFFATEAGIPVSRYDYWIDYGLAPPGLYGNHVILESVGTAPDGNSLAVQGRFHNRSELSLFGGIVFVVFKDAQFRVVGRDVLPLFFLDNALGPFQSRAFRERVSSFDLPASYTHVAVYPGSDQHSAVAPADLPTATPVPPSTSTPTRTPTITPTRTNTPTRTVTNTPTATSTFYPTPIGGWPYSVDLPHILHSRQPGATYPPAPTVALSPTITTTPTPSLTASITPTPTETGTPTDTPTASLTPTPTDTRTVTVTPTPTETPIPTATLLFDFYDSVENGNIGWVVDHSRGGRDWLLVTGLSANHSGRGVWWATDASSVVDFYMVSPAITVRPNAILNFWHMYTTESEYDGGVVEISNNNGQSWTDLGTRMTRNGYNVTIRSSTGSPIAGQRAFSGRSSGFIDTRANLDTYANQTVKVRFRMTTDESESMAQGWWLDDIYVGPVDFIRP